MIRLAGKADDVKLDRGAVEHQGHAVSEVHARFFLDDVIQHHLVRTLGVAAPPFRDVGTVDAAEAVIGHLHAVHNECGCGEDVIVASRQGTASFGFGQEGALRLGVGVFTANHHA